MWALLSVTQHTPLVLFICPDHISLLSACMTYVFFKDYNERVGCCSVAFQQLLVTSAWLLLENHLVSAFKGHADYDGEDISTLSQRWLDDKWQT